MFFTACAFKGQVHVFYRTSENCIVIGPAGQAQYLNICVPCSDSAPERIF